MSGGDGRLLVARPRDGGGRDLGFVGEIEQVNVDLLTHLMDVSVPVVATVATDLSGQAYNVNADLAASAIAVAVGASKLVFVTDVEECSAGELLSGAHRDELPLAGRGGTCRRRDAQAGGRGRSDRGGCRACMSWTAASSMR